jgi:hypothetical protein
VQPLDHFETERAVDRRANVFGIIRGVLFSPRAWFSDMPAGTATGAVGIALLVNVGSEMARRCATFGFEPALASHYRGLVGQTLLVILLPAVGIYVVARVTKKSESFGLISCALTVMPDYEVRRQCRCSPRLMSQAE